MQDDGARVLAARARRGRDPAGAAARARPGRGAGPHAALGRSAGAPRRWSFRGEVPPSQYAAMRAPFQDGDFPGPVKYGYLNVGVVEQGPPPLLGRTVFCLYPHQTAYVVPASAVAPVPDGVPPGRAVLAGTVETAVNALWDAAPLRRRPDHRGRRRHGRLLRRAAARAASPASHVDAGRRRPGSGRASRPRSASTSPRRPTPPATATWSCTPARPRPGCSGRWTCCAPTARSSSSAGTATPRSPLSLGGAFHSRRLDDPGQPGRRRWRPARRRTRTPSRLALALDLLRDPRLRRAAHRRRRRSTSCPR